MTQILKRFQLHTNIDQQKCLCWKIKQKVGEQWLEYNARSTEAKIATLRYFYPHQEGFQSYKMHTKTILAATNRQIDDWNSIVQKLNPNYADEQTHKCLISFSSDVLSAVDDSRAGCHIQYAYN
jgi:hypothetical protein